MQRSLSSKLFVLCFVVAGCSLAPAGFVLKFPDAAYEMQAASAVLVVGDPATPDPCARYLVAGAADPPNSVTSSPIALKNGKASGPWTKVPNGTHTAIVKVLDSGGNLLLHGCYTGELNSGDNIEITLLATNAVTTDMSPADAAPDLISTGDMAVSKTLSITTIELRDSTRKLQGATVSVQDATGSTRTGTTDVNGNTHIETSGLTAPFQVTALAAPSNGYTGTVTVVGANPTFTSGSANMRLPIELDPPATAAASTITVTDNNAAYQVYYQNFAELPTDLPAPLSFAKGTGTVQPLTSAATYRLMVVDSTGVATNSPPTSPGNATTLGTFAPINGSLTMNMTASPNGQFTTQKYGARLVVHGATGGSADTNIPLVPPTTLVASAAVAVPSNPGSILSGGDVTVDAELTATGSNVEAELRQAFSPTVPSSTSIGPVPAPPTIVVPSPVPSPSPFTVSGTPPAGFPTANAFCQISIYNAAGTYHWRVIAPFSNPTTVTLPGGVLPAGSYNVDVSYIQDFAPLSAGTVANALVTDYSTLIRVVPQELTRATAPINVE